MMNTGFLALRRPPRRRLRLARAAAAAAAVLTLLGASSPARAQASSPAAADDEVARLRQQLEQLKRDYDERIAALERRVTDLAAASAGTAAAAPAAGQQAAPEAAQPPAPQAQAPPPAPPAAPAEAPAQAQAAPPEAPPASPPGAEPVLGGGNSGALSKVFNPDMAVIGNFVGATGTNHVENSPALQLDEAEASFQAVVDPYARGDFFVSFGPDGAQVEEGFITFTALPGGLLAKVGKMRSAFGKVNAMHTHVLPWTDRPLVTRNLVGGEDGISDAGLSVSKLLVNPLFFLEATGEVFGGQSGVFQGSQRSHVSYTGRLRGYRDLTEGTNLDLGTSYAWGHTDLDPEPEADGTRQLFGIDGTFRWRPLRRAIYRRFIGRTELVWSQDHLTTGRDTAFGMYASGEYQFAQRWFAGLRYDHSERPLATTHADKGGALTVTFWPSEFSQVRGEYRHTRYAGDVSANEFLFQFLFSIGAHGAHVF